MKENGVMTFYYFFLTLLIHEHNVLQIREIPLINFKGKHRGNKPRKSRSDNSVAVEFMHSFLTNASGHRDDMMKVQLCFQLTSLHLFPKFMRPNTIKY